MQDPLYYSLLDITKEVRRLQNVIKPSVMVEIQRSINSVSDFGRNKHLIAFAEQLRANYLPLNFLIPIDFTTKLNKRNEEISMVLKILSTSINNLSGLNYDLHTLIQDEIEDESKFSIIDNSKNIIKSIYEDHSLLDIIEPREFEEVVAELLQNKGFEVSLTGRTRDGGYDILAMTHQGDIPFKMLVECKRHKKKIGVEVIRSFCDVIHREKANKGIIFTTSYFSKPSQVRKEEKGALLDLRNRNDLLKWIIQYSIKN
ncbi:restriction endonuclease [Flavobacteriaceae bacterium F08102]|nr:restriction endonuclease [Flavobacteriaceae bacterium F08102]